MLKRDGKEPKKGSKKGSRTRSPDPSNPTPPAGVKVRRGSITEEVQSAHVTGSWVGGSKKPEDEEKPSASSTQRGEKVSLGARKRRSISQTFHRRVVKEVKAMEKEEKEKEKEKEREKGKGKGKGKDKGKDKEKDKENHHKDEEHKPKEDKDGGKRSRRRTRELPPPVAIPPREEEEHRPNHHGVKEVMRVAKSGKYRCAACDGRIPKKTTMASIMDGKRKYHLPCFKCYDCQARLQGDYGLSGGHPVCVKCLSHRNPSCAECHLPIKGPLTEAMGKKWHPEHFCCSHCHKPLNATYDTQSFFVEKGKPYCADDYFELFGKRCSCGCNEIITKELLLYHESTYKPRHFVCKNCNSDLSKLDVDHIVVISQPSSVNVLFCSDKCVCEFSPSAYKAEIYGKYVNVSDYVTKAAKTAPCWWCNGPIMRGTPIFTSPEGVVCHPQHLVCESCGKTIEKKFQWREGGQPHCTTCSDKLTGMVTTYFSTKEAVTPSSPLPIARKCTVCDLRVQAGQPYLMSPDINPVIFHASCAICDECENVIEGEFLWKNSFPLCSLCWRRSPITPDGKSPPLGALGSSSKRLSVPTLAIPAAGGAREGTPPTLSRSEIAFKRVNEEKRKSGGSSTCEWCDCVILINQLILTSPMGMSYHLDHFNCGKCDNLIKNKFVWIKNKPCCQNCAVKELSTKKKKEPLLSAAANLLSAPAGETCDYCDEALRRGERVLFSKPLLRYFHREHFMCFQCGLLIADKYLWIDGFQHCEQCAEAEESEPLPGEVLGGEAVARSEEDEPIKEDFHSPPKEEPPSMFVTPISPDSRVGNSQPTLSKMVSLSSMSRISVKQADCFTCKKPIRLGGSSVCSPLGPCFHEGCVVCRHCKKTIEPKESFGWCAGFPACPECVKSKGLTLEDSSPLRVTPRKDAPKDRVALVLPVFNSMDDLNAASRSEGTPPTRKRTATVVVAIQAEKATTNSDISIKSSPKTKLLLPLDGETKAGRVVGPGSSRLRYAKTASSLSMFLSEGGGGGADGGLKAPRSTPSSAMTGGGSPLVRSVEGPNSPLSKSGGPLEERALSSSDEGGRRRRGTTRQSMTLLREQRDDYVRLMATEEGLGAKAPETPKALTRRGTVLSRGMSMSSLFVPPAGSGGEAPTRTRSSTKRLGTSQEQQSLLPESKMVSKIEDVIEIKHVLGRGGFATVKMAIELETKEVVAVKTFNKWELEGEALVFLKREVSALAKIRHPNIVRLHQVLEDQHFVYMLIEFIKGENLFERLESTFTITERESQTVVKRLLECLAFLHEKKIVHQDVKTENMMLPSTAEDPFEAAKLIDFGFARPVRDDELLEEYCGSVDYLAPEIIERRPYHLAVDIWAAGCVMYNCLTGLRPFFSPEEAACGTIQWFDDDWDKITPQAKDLVQKLLIVDPKERYTAAQALEHDWFKIEIQDRSDHDDESDEEGDIEGDGFGDSSMYNDSEPIADVFEDSVREADGNQACVGCSEMIDEGAEMVVSPLGTGYHVDCFKCMICSDELRGDYVWKKGVPYCTDCFEKLAEGGIEYQNTKKAQPRDMWGVEWEGGEGTCCVWCEQEVGEEEDVFVSIKQKYVFHPGCLMCEECSEVVEGDFLWRRGIPCCRACFEKLNPSFVQVYPTFLSLAREVGPALGENYVCTWCEQPCPFAEPVVLSTKEKNPFHPGCLVCSECSEPVADEFLWRSGGIPCCRACYEKLFPPPEVKILSVSEENKPVSEEKQCMWCEKFISPGDLAIVSREGNAFHAGCLMCDECEQVPTEGFVWREGIPCCQGCWEKLHPPAAKEEMVEDGVIYSAKEQNKPVSEKKQCMWCCEFIPPGESAILSREGNAFHAKCLMCDECEQVAEEFVWREGIPCCRGCWEKLHPPAPEDGVIYLAKEKNLPVTEKKQCMWCCEFIPEGESAIVSREGNAFHAKCLMCDECEQVAEEFVWREGIPCCRGCWEKLNPPIVKEVEVEDGVVYSAKEQNKAVSEKKQCMWCCKFIPEGESAIVSREGNAFHIGCLICDECEGVAEEFVWREGIPCCRGCWEKIHPPSSPSPSSSSSSPEDGVIYSAKEQNKPVSEKKQCMWCCEFIRAGESAILSREGNAFHAKCLMCDECEQVAEEFVWREGIPCCRGCWEKIHPPSSPSPAPSSASSSSPSTPPTSTSSTPPSTPPSTRPLSPPPSQPSNVSPAIARVASIFGKKDSSSSVLVYKGSNVPATQMTKKQPKEAEIENEPQAEYFSMEMHPIFGVYPCAGCGSDVGKGNFGVLVGKEKRYHPKCFKCSGCAKVLENEYGVLGGEVKCRGCVV